MTISLKRFIRDLFFFILGMATMFAVTYTVLSPESAPEGAQAIINFFDNK